MLRKLVLGATVLLSPLGLVLGVAGAASASGNPPTVHHIAPHHGQANGGTAVAIEGTNFKDVLAVDFGTKAARSFSVQSARVIIARSPAGTGVVDVTVTTSTGTSATGKADQFTYSGAVLPVVTNVFPRHGRPAGGTSVVITGNDLEGATSVQFGSNAGTDVDVLSHHVVTAKSPAGTGVVDVTVTTPLGTSLVNRKDQFTYNNKTVPAVTHVTPHRGSTGGGTLVTIHGSNLTGATAVDFGANAATGVTVITSHLVTATSPAGAAGTVDVTVTTPDGTSATDTGDQFTYGAVGPVVTHIAPHKGPVAGGTVVAISGQNLSGTTAVDFGSTAASNVRVVSGKIVLATSPAGSVGAVDVTVTTPLGTSPVTPKDQFTYVAPK
jgi:IPT/TIG domain